jgi:hypothetical protein
MARSMVATLVRDSRCSSSHRACAAATASAPARSRAAFATADCACRSCSAASAARSPFSADLLHLTARGEPSPRHVAATRPALFAVLVAEATNIGLATMSRAAGIPYGQLVRVHDWCFREETLRQAITTLITYHRDLPLAGAFGPGTTSSSDGMRFGLSASTLQARHLPRYFGVRRGMSLLSHVSDQGPQFAMQVINCQGREATYALDGILHQDIYRIVTWSMGLRTPRSASGCSSPAGR